jgi:hypothetical protein
MSALAIACALVAATLAKACGAPASNATVAAPGAVALRNTLMPGAA